MHSLLTNSRKTEQCSLIMDILRLICSIITIFCSHINAQADTSAPETWRDHNHMRDKATDSGVTSESTDSLQNTQLKTTVERLEQMLINTQNELEQLKSDFLRLVDKQTDEKRRRRQVHCRSEFTWWHDTVGKSLEYLDNFDIHCRHGEFLRQWRMTWGEMSGKKAIRYVCCSFIHEPD